MKKIRDLLARKYSTLKKNRYCDNNHNDNSSSSNNNNNRSSVETLPPVEKSQLSKPLLNRRKTSLRACNSLF
ncbi:hypothetical protein T10_8395 [Trichinella papuae]|uniref:Uncharacterized protein n=1 Tax=Trichinella papuae TaxID=268474 RepID=A0A0V1MIS9_9BILA|nr:hypothetical protein T10_8395 [Trichinella papuae]